MRKINRGIAVGLLLLVAGVVQVQAQSPVVEKSAEKVKIKGKLYYVHLVKRGETLYSLARVYEVTIARLTEENPELAGGLREGQALKIPVADGTLPNTPTAAQTHPPVAATPAPVEQPATAVLSTATALTATPAAGVSDEQPKTVRPFYHEVKQGETLWSVARRYEVTVDDLRRYNPDALAGDELMIGVLLRLPPTPVEQTDTGGTADSSAAEEFAADRYLPLPTGELDKDPALLSRPIQVSLLLPLLVGKAPDDTVAVTTAIARLKSAENYYAFYEGALLAIEALKQQGLSLDLSVYDTYNAQNIRELLAKKTLQHEDLIFGPVYAANFRPVAEFAKEYGVKIISPLDPNTEVLTFDNPQMFQISPPFYCRQKKLIDHFLSHTEANMVLIYEAGSRDTLLVESYKNLLGERVNEVVMLPYTLSRNNTALRTSLTELLATDKENCVLVASNNEALVADVAAHLYLQTVRQRYLITLYGPDRWRNFETIDLKYFHALNLHMVVPFYIDYTGEQVQNFVAHFQETYKADPSQYAFQGYDTFYYFLQAVMLYGKDFEKYLAEYAPKLLQTNYTFRYHEHYRNGLVNVESCLINYTPDYAIVKR